MHLNEVGAALHHWIFSNDRPQRNLEEGIIRSLKLNYLEMVIAPLLPPEHVSSCFRSKSIGTWDLQFTHDTFGLMEICKKRLH